MSKRPYRHRYPAVKAIISTLALATALAVAQQETPGTAAKPAAPEVTLKPGSPVRIESLASSKWIQGEALKEFEPGKVYLFECWATWCGPCIAAIPHVNDLHKRYRDKGLRVIGVNVWEDGLEKVEKFVTGKGDGMSYPVVYTGKGSDFENEWLKPAGVRGIPRALIVRDGKLVLSTHPAQLKDAVIEALLSGGEGAAEAAEKINAAATARDKTGTVVMAFRQASAKNDTAAMAESLAELEKLDADNPYLKPLRVELCVARKDWDGANKLIAAMPEGPDREMTLAMAASRVGLREGDYPADFVKSLATAYSARLDKNTGRRNPMEYITLAALLWKGGEKESALASAEKAQAAASADQGGRKLPAAPFERFTQALKEDKLPTMQEFSTWIAESMKASGNASGVRIVPPPKKS
jgi:thiol-disulfide isomerase/thioredoxin